MKQVLNVKIEWNQYYQAVLKEFDVRNGTYECNIEVGSGFKNVKNLFGGTLNVTKFTRLCNSVCKPQKDDFKDLLVSPHTQEEPTLQIFEVLYKFNPRFLRSFPVLEK
jgi:hypothetical protein